MPLLDRPGTEQPSTPNTNSKSATGGILDSALNILDPAGIRTQLAGLFSGGTPSPKGVTPQVKVVTAGQKSEAIRDWRVKISLPAGSGLSYGSDNPLLNILTRTNGVVFPYTPTISVTHTARYAEQALTHSNYKNYFYEGSDVSAINIVGDFTVQNRDDALYVLAATYFFRSVTKMFWGKDTYAGNPPPLVFLNGYGDYYFPNVSCVVTSFQHTMPAEVDYMEVYYSEGSNTYGKTIQSPVVNNSTKNYARVPINSQFNITLQPVYSRKNIATNMTLDSFSKGKLLSGKGGFL